MVIRVETIGVKWEMGIECYIVYNINNTRTEQLEVLKGMYISGEEHKL